jgi:enamine deaminase RidA (YjgF/YER057c/UK114 family)
MDVLKCVYESFRTAFLPTLPAMTLVGVTRLAYPQLKIEIEATVVV